MRIGINPISWTNDDLPALGGETPLETALAEGKAIGYEGFELGNKFPREPDALARGARRDTASPACRAGTRAGSPAGRSPRRSRSVEAHLELLAANGAQVMVYGEVADTIQGRPDAARRGGRASRPTPNGRAYGERMTAFGAAHCSPAACVSPTITTWAPMSRPPRTSTT